MGPIPLTILGEAEQLSISNHSLRITSRLQSHPLWYLLSATMKGLLECVIQSVYHIVSKNPRYTALVLMLWSLNLSMPFKICYIVFYNFPKAILLHIISCFKLNDSSRQNDPCTMTERRSLLHEYSPSGRYFATHQSYNIPADPYDFDIEDQNIVGDSTVLCFIDVITKWISMQMFFAALVIFIRSFRVPVDVPSRVPKNVF
ncbi:hypothetical protein F5887DRAFT_1006144 [Amanita rubescens]|nr:hypothetical protein F5887DRAFT_1006144 [Amanita rubescens]